MEKISKNYRILNMYQRLCSGKCLNKQEEAKQFGVDERSIQRDIDDIRAFLMEQTDNSGDSRQVVYDRSRKGYVLTGAEQALMSNDEILAVSKILLESRAFTKKEINEINLMEIKSLGELFNPELHRCLAVEKNKSKVENQIISVVEKGYMLNGRVIRPASVIIVK